MFKYEFLPFLTEIFKFLEIYLKDSKIWHNTSEEFYQFFSATKSWLHMLDNNLENVVIFNGRFSNQSCNSKFYAQFLNKKKFATTYKV